MKSMKYMIVLAMSMLTLTACEKDNYRGKLQLVAEGYGNGTKVAVDGLASSWVEGDSVWINGGKFIISVNNESTATVSSSPDFESPFRGVYPASIIDGIAGNTVTLNLPASYTYGTTSGTKQELGSPMVAYAEGSGSLFFKHVTAAIGVQVKNYHEYDITVDQIQVTSNKYKLNGSITVELDDEINIDAATTEVASEKTVTMNFGTPLTIAAGSSKTVQIPVLPVGSDNKFTVSIQVSKTAPDVSITLTRTQATAGAMARAEIGYAMYTIGGPFTINSAGDKVVFAKGNLQYNANSTNAAEAPYTPAWRFAPNQYDYIGSDNSNIADDYYGWIDLIDFTSANGSTIAGWRVLEKDPYDYLCSTRSTSTTGLTGTNSNVARYVKAKVGNVVGFILFPDNFIMPESITVNTGGGTTFFNGNGAQFTFFQISASDWGKMEFAGAVFLPAAGWRDGTTVKQVGEYGYYWSSTTATTAGYSLVFYNTNVVTRNSWTNATQSYGHSVRLVKTTTL